VRWRCSREQDAAEEALAEADALADDDCVRLGVREQL